MHMLFKELNAHVYGYLCVTIVAIFGPTYMAVHLSHWAIAHWATTIPWRKVNMVWREYKGGLAPHLAIIWRGAQTYKGDSCIVLQVIECELDNNDYRVV
jgi:hypothetical protein